MHDCKFDPENAEDRKSNWRYQFHAMRDSAHLFGHLLDGKITLEEFSDRLSQFLLDNPCPCSVKSPEPEVPQAFLTLDRGFRYIFDSNTSAWVLCMSYAGKWRHLTAIALTSIANETRLEAFNRECGQFLIRLTPTEPIPKDLTIIR